MPPLQGSAANRTALRETLLRRRRQLAVDEVASRSQRLAEVIRASAPFRAAPVIAAFVGVRNEPHTDALIDAALALGKAVWLPAVRGDVLVFARIRARSELRPAGFGLLEPIAAPGETTMSLGELAPALVLVPGLAFARTGARIGFGKGHYDRALAPLRARIDCVRMGVCFAGFLDPHEGPIPIAAHDVPMHQVATENGVGVIGGDADASPE